MNKNQYNKILVVKHGSLGDIAFSLLAMASIKKKFYNAKIDLLTEAKYENFLSKSNHFTNIIQDNRGGVLSSLKIIYKLNRKKYDLIIDLQNSKRTNNYWFLLKLISKVTINGSRSNSDIKYTIPPQGKESPQRGLYNQLKLIGINNFVQDINWLSIDTLEIKGGKIILMIPCVSKSGKHKQWSPNKFGELAKNLEKKGYQICNIGQESDKETLDPIVKSCEKIINLTGKSPPEIIYSLSKISDLIISNDTGPGHIAALSHSPILFLGKDNVVSKSNLSEYKNAYKILTDSMDKLSIKTVIDFLNEKKLISK